MASLVEFGILTLSDQAVVDAFERVLDHLPGAGDVWFIWSVQGLPDGRCSFEGVRAHQRLQPILDSELEVFNTARLEFVTASRVSVKCIIERSAAGTKVKAHLDGSSEERPGEVETILIAVKMAFKPHLPLSALGTLLPELAAFYRRRDETLVQLEGLTARLIRENDEYRRKLDGQQEDECRRLTASFDKKAATLEQQYRQREDVLNDRLIALDSREKELDDRNNTHARRKLQSDMRTKLQELATSFTLTPTTSRKRVLAAAGYLILVSVLGYAAFSAWEASTQAPPQGVPAWFYLVKAVIGVAGMAAAIVYFIRWQDRWADTHASEEFRLKRLGLDMDRASWLAEMMLEWKHGQGGELPNGLVERLSVGLFEQAGLPGRVTHPAEDVASFLTRFATNIQVRVPGADIALERSRHKQV